MKKRIMALSMILTLVFGLSTAAYADDTTPTAVFDGSDEIKYNYQDTNNFGNAFANMLPGEDRTQEIVLQNTSDQSVDFFMRTEVLKAFEDTEQRSNAAYQITLTVTKGADTTTIYGGAEADGSVRVGGDEQGLKNMNGSLNDWLKLATLTKGENAVIRLQVYLDGESHSNDYQAAEGTFQFEFRAGYEEPTVIKQQNQDKVVTKTVVTDGPVNRIVRLVQTGDNAPIFLFVLLAVAAVIVLAVVVVKTKTKDDSNTGDAANEEKTE